jgi:hypothetical protein
MGTNYKITECINGYEACVETVNHVGKEIETLLETFDSVILTLGPITTKLEKNKAKAQEYYDKNYCFEIGN